MKTVFILSLINAAMSLLAMLGISAITFAPGAASTRARMMPLAAVFGIVWFCVALWARPRQHSATDLLPPLWLRRSLVGISVAYLLCVFAFLFG
jgi:hypothetical protein